MQPSNQWLINLSNNESLWATELNEVPSMIHFEYAQLKGLAREGQVYGVLLQCKDTYETILKIPVIMALVIIDSVPIYKDGAEYAEIMKAFLESPMSMGNWDNLARVIVGKNKKLLLPESLIEILKRTRKLYSTEITTTVSNVVNWRNETIGHGALKFQDDVSYQEEVNNLLKLLKEYFDGDGKFSIKALYGDCYFQCGENKLVAGCYEKNINNVSMSLHVAAQSFPVANYINDCDLKWYLFESFYRRKNLVKYSSYVDGKNNTVQNKYFSDLFAKHVLQGSKDSVINSDYISREEDLILEYLHMPSDYVAPTRIIELLQEKMEEIEKGVITISMERGTGKSAFSNQMSGLYHPKPLIKNSLSRCYHVSNAALRGLSDLTNSINNGFRHSFNPADDFWGSTEELPSLTLETENPAESMAEFLNFYHEKYRKDYTILIIDGIDEITEQAERILDFIPSKDQLDDGVFVVITTRFADEETVKGKSKKYIEAVLKRANFSLEVRRHDEINVELLNQYIDKYIKTFKLVQNIDKDALIEKSDYRILYLRAYLGISDRVDLDNTNETKFIKSYMDYILSFYGISQKQTLKEIVVTIALFPGISIKQYQEYLNCQEITYEFVGLFNDLLPLLTVTHLDGEDAYEFADTAYADFVIEEYSDVVKDVTCFFESSMKSHLEDFLCSKSMFYNTTGNKNLNNDIAFFLEGYLKIWRKFRRMSMLPEISFNYRYIIVLLIRLDNNYWTSSGYGRVLKQEWRDLVTELLYYGLKETSENKSEFWSERINLMLTYVKEIRLLRFNLVRGIWFDKLHDYIIENHNKIENIEDWCWVLEEYFYHHNNISLKDYLKIVKNSVGIEFFVNYLLNDNHVYNSVCWVKELLEMDISAHTEIKLIDYILGCCLNDTLNLLNKRDDFIKCVNLCLNIIKQKKLSIELNGRIVGIKELESKIQLKGGGANKYTYFLKKAIEELEDFAHPITHKSGCKGNIFKAFKPLIYPNKGEIASEDKLKLYIAFYQRMRYENNMGNLGDFLDRVLFLQKGMVIILTALYGTGDSFYKKLLLWIEEIKKVSCNKTSKNIKDLLDGLIRLRNDYIKGPNNANEFIVELEKLVCEADARGYLSHCDLDFGSNKMDFSIVYQIKDMIYGFETSLFRESELLYLLKMFANNGDKKSADRLLTLLEKSIPVIDKIFKIDKYREDYDILAKSEVIKYKILSLMQEMGYSNNLVLYLEDSLNSHKKKIDSFLNVISRRSNFFNLSFDIELWLEYFWQSKKWETGQKCCQELIEKLEKTANCTHDSSVREILSDEMEKVRICKTFFAFMNGEQVVVQTDRESFYGFGGTSLYDGATTLHNGRLETEFDKQQFISLIEIQMQHIKSSLIITKI